MKTKQVYMLTSILLFFIAIGLFMEALSGTSSEYQYIVENGVSAEDVYLRLGMIIAGIVAVVFWKLAVKKNDKL